MVNWSKEDVYKAQDRIDGKINRNATIIVDPVAIHDDKRSTRDVHIAHITGMHGRQQLDMLLCSERAKMLRYRLYDGEYMTDEEMVEMGFVRIDLAAMGAVRTTAMIAKMSIDRIKSEGNRSAKRRWLAYCTWKDGVRAMIGKRDRCSRLDMVVEMEPPGTIDGVRLRKADRVAMYTERRLADCKPDIDNIAKGVMDAIMTEDKGVSILFGLKRWSIRACMWIRIV